MNEISLAGKIAVVTGGGRGIGRQIALDFAKAGAKVAVTARSQDQLQETVKMIKEQGGECQAVVMDVSDPKSVTDGFAQIESDIGPIDVLVNNAGVGGKGIPPWEFDPQDWWRTQEVNLRGPFLCSYAVLTNMVERKQGCIINLASNAGLQPEPYASAYSVSKASLIHLTSCLAAAAKEFEGGFSVFAISPGLVLTEMTQDVPIFKDLPDSAWSSVEEAGKLCLVLASGQADKLSGRYIHVREDNIFDLIERADEIVENNLNVMKFQR